MLLTSESISSESKIDFFHSISESKVSTTSATTATTTFDETTTISGNANVENKTALVAIYF